MRKIRRKDGKKGEKKKPLIFPGLRTRHWCRARHLYFSPPQQAFRSFRFFLFQSCESTFFLSLSPALALSLSPFDIPNISNFPAKRCALFPPLRISSRVSSMGPYQERGEKSWCMKHFSSLSIFFSYFLPFLFNSHRRCSHILFLPRFSFSPFQVPSRGFFPSIFFFSSSFVRGLDPTEVIESTHPSNGSRIFQLRFLLLIFLQGPLLLSSAAAGKVRNSRSVPPSPPWFLTSIDGTHTFHCSGREVVLNSEPGTRNHRACEISWKLESMLFGGVSFREWKGGGHIALGVESLPSASFVYVLSTKKKTLIKAKLLLGLFFLSKTPILYMLIFLDSVSWCSSPCFSLVFL